MSASPSPRLVNDSAVYCDDGGAGFQPDRPTLVLLHGALNDHSVWSPQLRALTGHVNVLAPDLPGHGASAGPALSSVEAMADWLIALLDAAGIASAMLAGHSMGSLIALEAAYRQPARVTRLALLGSTWPMRVAPALLEMALDDEPAAIALVAKWSHAGGEGAAGSVEQAVQLMTRLAAGADAAGSGKLLHTDLQACNAYANGEVAARSIACPVTLITASADRMTPPKSTTTLRAALRHQFNEVELQSGHQMMAEQPDAVATALLAFASP